MAILSLLVLLMFFSTARADDGNDWSTGQICGLVFGGIFIVLVIIAFLGCCCARIYSAHGKMFSAVNETASSALVVAQPPLPPPSLPSSPPSPTPQIPGFNTGYWPSSDTVGPLYGVQDASCLQAGGKDGYYTSPSGYIHENPMTISQSYSCKAERSNTVMASAPLASLESIPHEDLSDSSVYRRFFSPETDTSLVKSPVFPLSPESSINPPHPPSSLSSRISKFSLALRDAARVFRLGTGKTTGSGSVRQEDTITLEDGTAISSSLPQSSLNTGSQARLFKQQKRPKKNSSASGGMSSGSKIGRKTKISSVSQDTGHCNSFEVTEMDEMESSVDNDRFLHSLESAVFTTPANMTRDASNNVSPLYSSSSTLSDGDLGDVGGYFGGNSLYPPLPPGSPVIGFAYLGLGGLQEEEEMGFGGGQRDKESGSSREANASREFASSTGKNSIHTGAFPLEDEVKPPDISESIDQRDLIASFHNSSSSATSATAMLSTLRGTKHSISASETDIRLPSANVEPWMVASDEHLLVLPSGDASARFQGRGSHSMHSLSSSNLMKK